MRQRVSPTGEPAAATFHATQLSGVDAPRPPADAETDSEEVWRVLEREVKSTLDGGRLDTGDG
jgi:hypothetical protein